MAAWFIAAGHDALHTLDLPDGNRTTDSKLIELADTEGRIVVTKDNDFVDSHLLQRQPEKLLLISTGNIANQVFEQLIVPLIPQLAVEFGGNSFIEFGPAGLVVRG